MKATHIKKDGTKIAYLKIPFKISAYELEYQIQVLMERGNLKPTKKQILDLMKGGLTIAGEANFSGLLRHESDSYMSGKENGEFVEEAHELAKKLFPTFY